MITGNIIIIDDSPIDRMILSQIIKKNLAGLRFFHVRTDEIFVIRSSRMI